jgi:hypothetical protein
MQFHKLQSSSLDSIAYNEKAKELTVIFKNNAMYRYDGVSKTEYEQILNSTSAGTKLKEITKNKTYKKI